MCSSVSMQVKKVFVNNKYLQEEFSLGTATYCNPEHPKKLFLSTPFFVAIGTWGSSESDSISKEQGIFFYVSKEPQQIYQL